MTQKRFWIKIAFIRFLWKCSLKSGSFNQLLGSFSKTYILSDKFLRVGQFFSFMKPKRIKNMGVASKIPSNWNDINEENHVTRQVKYFDSRIRKNVVRHIFVFKSNFEFFLTKMNELSVNHLTKKITHFVDFTIFSPSESNCFIFSRCF